MKNHMRIFTQQVVAMNPTGRGETGKLVTIEVWADPAAIARKLYLKALENKSGQSKIVSGAVVVKVVR